MHGTLLPLYGKLIFKSEFVKVALFHDHVAYHNLGDSLGVDHFFCFFFVFDYAVTIGTKM